MERLKLYVSMISLGVATILHSSGDIRAQSATPQPGEAAIDSALRSGAFDKAAALLQRRAKAGDVEAQYQLASLYRAGRGVAQDDALAFKWMKRAAEGGHIRAAYSLGTMYLSGRGAAVNVAAARNWLNAAALAHHEQAIRLLAEINTARGAKERTVTENQAVHPERQAETVKKAGARSELSPELLISSAIADGTMPPFVDAAWRGREKLVVRFIAAKVELEQKDAAGNTALAVAAMAGHLAIVEALADAGANVDAVNNRRESPLMMAASNKRGAVFARLVAMGADVNRRDAAGATVLDMATRACDADMVANLVSKGARAGQEMNGQTLLMRAAESCDARVLSSLGSQGGAFDSRTARGETALWFAADKGNEGAIRYLVAQGADVEVADVSGDTPLMRALARGVRDAAPVLLENIRTVDKANNNGNTALMLAAKSNMPDVVAQLIAMNVDVNARNAMGYSAMMFAAQEGNAAIVKQLLSAGADHSLRNKKREKASDIALAFGHADVVAMLK
ncbi:MAG: ankyrin repeat domain-containing protein [Hyphomicrobium sp.]